MTDSLNTLILSELDNLKGQAIVTLDVETLSDVMETLIIVSGTSSRHVKSLADNVVEQSKKVGIQPIGVEGMGSDWVLVDYGSTVLHVMLPEARVFYDLEKLWTPISSSSTQP